jgi:hypothetical protein
MITFSIAVVSSFPSLTNTCTSLWIALTTGTLAFRLAILAIVSLGAGLFTDFTHPPWRAVAETSAGDKVTLLSFPAGALVPTFITIVTIVTA